MTPLFTRDRLTSRNLCLLGLVVVACAFAGRDLLSLARAAMQYDQYSHVLIVLPLSAALLYLDASNIFRKVTYYPAAIGGLVLAGIGFFYVPAHASVLQANDALSISILCLVIWLISAFTLYFGTQAFWTARFPLLFLLLMVPLPVGVLDRTVAFLQNGSADVTYWMLRAADVPVFRRGIVLSLPGIDIEVATECSGIRSSLMLFIVSLVMGHLFLRTGWRKVLFTVAVLPITILKNSLRIFTLSTLSVYVDPSVLNSRLHTYGGIPFFVSALGSLLLVLWAFHRAERNLERGQPLSGPRRNPVFLNGGV